MRYVRASSLAWWAGLAPPMNGSASLMLPYHGQLAAMSRPVAELAGAEDAVLTTLITLGLGFIGLRDRIERGFPPAGR